MISFRPDVDDDCDDVKGGRNWWSQMPPADRFPPILAHLPRLDRDHYSDRDENGGGHHDDYDEYIFLRLASLLLPVFY